MIIALENDLHSMKSELIKRGYDVVSLDDGVPADVILYSSGRFPYYGGMNSLTALSSIEDSYRGALLINVVNKSLDEIINTINSKTYSSLF